MLPTPVFTKRSRGALHASFNILRQRSRATNLSVLLVCSLLSFSLLLNLRLWYNVPRDSINHEIQNTILRQQPHSFISILPRVKAKDLVIVAGHAIWKGCLPERRLDDSDWILEEYQKGSRSITAFFSHIVRGAEIMLQDDDSLLVFSGGHTRAQSTASEGESYLRLAIESNLFHNAFSSFERAASEEYALDSYQNVLFSIARFHELTGTYPHNITVVGFEMKRRRFEELHIRALRWPRERFTYVGIDEHGDTTVQYQGENQNGYLPFSQDLYGCHGTLQLKRVRRNPFNRFHPYHLSSPELADLLDWCPTDKNTIFPKSLPWAHS